MRLGASDSITPPRFRFLIFGYDRMAQFQIVAGDMSHLGERVRTQLKQLAEEVSNHGAIEQLPTGLHSPLGFSHCLLLSIPITTVESFSNRTGLKVVVVLHAAVRGKLHVGELLSMWRILEFSLSKALFGVEQNLSLTDSANKLGALLQAGFSQTERDDLNRLVNAASRTATMTQGAAANAWAFPVDMTCGSILATLSNGARVRDCKQISFYLPYGSEWAAETSRATACHFGPAGAYVSYPVQRRKSQPIERWRNRSALLKLRSR